MSRRRKSEIRRNLTVAGGTGTDGGSSVRMDEYDGVVCHLNLTALTAGNVELFIDGSADGVNWSQARNELGALYRSGTVTSVSRITWVVPLAALGKWLRVRGVVTTGPADYVVDIELVKAGGL